MRVFSFAVCVLSLVSLCCADQSHTTLNRIKRDIDVANAEALPEALSHSNSSLAANHAITDRHASSGFRTYSAGTDFLIKAGEAAADTLVGEIPVVGGFLSSLLSAFWPSSSTGVTVEQVQQMLDDLYNEIVTQFSAHYADGNAVIDLSVFNSLKDSIGICTSRSTLDSLFACLTGAAGPNGGATDIRGSLQAIRGAVTAVQDTTAPNANVWANTINYVMIPIASSVMLFELGFNYQIYQICSANPSICNAGAYGDELITTLRQYQVFFGKVYQPALAWRSSKITATILCSGDNSADWYTIYTITDSATQTTQQGSWPAGSPTTACCAPGGYNYNNRGCDTFNSVVPAFAEYVQGQLAAAQAAAYQNIVDAYNNYQAANAFVYQSVPNTVCTPNNWMNVIYSPLVCQQVCIATSASSSLPYATIAPNGACQCEATQSTYCVQAPYTTFVPVSLVPSYTLTGNNTVCTVTDSAHANYTPQQCKALCGLRALPYAVMSPNGDCYCGSAASNCFFNTGWSVYTSSAALASCTTAGYAYTNGACSPCPAGTFSSGGVCSGCPAGTYSAQGSTSCSSCASSTPPANTDLSNYCTEYAAALTGIVCISSWMQVNFSPQQCAAYCFASGSSSSFATSAANGACQCSSTLTNCVSSADYTTYIAASVLSSVANVAYTLTAPNTVCQHVGNDVGSGLTSNNWLGVRWTTTPQTCINLCASLPLSYALVAPNGDCNCGSSVSYCYSNSNTLNYRVYHH